jgi:hypothetical protein
MRDAISPVSLAITTGACPRTTGWPSRKQSRVSPSFTMSTTASIRSRPSPAVPRDERMGTRPRACQEDLQPLRSAPFGVLTSRQHLTISAPNHEAGSVTRCDASVPRRTTKSSERRTTSPNHRRPGHSPPPSPSPDRFDRWSRCNPGSLRYRPRAAPHVCPEWKSTGKQRSGALPSVNRTGAPVLRLVMSVLGEDEQFTH